jgi:branched-chain amino acid transport system substrate-binding protein
MYIMTRKYASTMFTLVLVALLSACGGEKEKIYIGLAGPLSAANGISMKRAAEMAVREINGRGGIDGRDLVLVPLDDSASVDYGITVATQLKANPQVVAVIGHVNSAVSLRAATIYNSSDSTGPVVQISPASSAPALSQSGEWTFRVTPTDLEFSPQLAKHARQLGLQRAAVLYANDDYGQGVMATFQAAFESQQGQVVSADPFLPAVVARGTELDPYLTRAIGRGADALIIGGQAAEGVKIIQAARRLGFRGPILGADGMTGVKDAGPVAEGVFVASAFLPDRPDTTAQRFVEAYRTEYNALPDHRGAMTYDIVYLLARALEEAGTDRQAVRDYVASIGSGTPKHLGVSGEIAFDSVGDVVNKPVMVGVVRGGQLVTATTR